MKVDFEEKKFSNLWGGWDVSRQMNGNNFLPTSVKWTGNVAPNNFLRMNEFW